MPMEVRGRYLVAFVHAITPEAVRGGGRPACQITGSDGSIVGPLVSLERKILMHECHAPSEFRSQIHVEQVSVIGAVSARQILKSSYRNKTHRSYLAEIPGADGPLLSQIELRRPKPRSILNI
jgi:hypothetical protein